MKLYYKIGVSDDLGKLFENPNSKLGEGWEIFLELEGKKIDDWITKNFSLIEWFGTNIRYCEEKYEQVLNSAEMHKIVYFAIQVYAFQKGLDLYLQDPTRRRLEDDIFMSMAQMGFAEEALEFCQKKYFSLFYTGK